MCVKSRVTLFSVSQLASVHERTGRGNDARCFRVAKEQTSDRSALALLWAVLSFERVLACAIGVNHRADISGRGRGRLSSFSEIMRAWMQPLCARGSTFRRSRCSLILLTGYQSKPC